jgi:uncharacterized protein YndB with AHSA1/START domain
MTLKNSRAATVTTPSDRELVITRTFDAPRWLVFDAMTRPEHLVHWWGLRGSTLVVCEVDLRVGGAWHYVVRGADGVDHGFSGVYQELTPPERIVSTEGYDPLPGHDYLVTATFDERDGKTYLTSHLRYKSKEDRDGHVNSGMEGGMQQTYQRLDEHLAQQLASRRTVVITRLFDAPRELVWKAWTDPNHLMRWWGPEGFTSPAATIDLRVGGKYHFAMRSPEGQDFWSTGYYREIVPNERLVCTDSFSNAQGDIVSPTEHGMGADVPTEFLVTVTLEDVGGKTRMTLTHIGLPAGEMEAMTVQGWNGSFDKLAVSLK